MTDLNAEQWRLLRTYVQGFGHVFCQVCIASLLALWVIQAIATAHGEIYDWSAILRQLLLTLSFMVFYPGQQFWTYRMQGPDDEFITIVGREPPGDLAED